MISIKSGISKINKFLFLFLFENLANSLLTRGCIIFSSFPSDFLSADIIFFVRYLYLIFFLSVLGYLILFFNLNSSFVDLDFYFYKLNGTTLGFIIIVAFFLGMLLSYFLQLPVLLRKRKIKSKNNDS